MSVETIEVLGEEITIDTNLLEIDRMRAPLEMRRPMALTRYYFDDYDNPDDGVLESELRDFWGY